MHFEDNVILTEKLFLLYVYRIWISSQLFRKIVHKWYTMTVIYFFIISGGHMSIFEATDTPVLDVSSGFQSQSG